MSDQTRSPSDEYDAERDDVAVLMRVAGKRRAVPQERFDRVRDAARAEWRQAVGRRSRARSIRVAAFAAAAAAVLVLALAIRFLPFDSPVGRDPAATVRVAALVGAGWTNDGSGRRDLVAGEALPSGAEIGTSIDGRVALGLVSGHTVRLDRTTRVRLLDVGAGALALDSGAVYVDSGVGGDSAATVEVHTPLGIVREIGTQFEVRLEDDGLRVRLREGLAVVSRDGRTHEVRPGGELRLDADGNVTRGAIARDAADWTWLHDVTTVPPLDGRTARGFLDWVVRERGWTLEFADDDVALAAETTILGGTADGLTIDEALDAVLPTCRLTYRIDDGVLRIESER